MTREELPKDVQNMILDEIHKTEKFMKLASTYHALKIKGQFAQAHLINQKMREIEESVFREFLRETTKAREAMSNILSPMNEEDKASMNAYANGLMLLSDVIEVFVSEMNQIVKKYRPDMRVTSFDKINYLSKEAKKNVLLIDRTLKDEYMENLFGDTADKMFGLIYNQAKSFCTKLNKHAERVDKKAKSSSKVA